MNDTRTVNLIDGSNIFFISLGMLEHTLGDTPLSEEHYHKFLSIFAMKIQQFMTADYNVVTFEGQNSTAWRKERYPEYKANRAAKKATDSYKHVGPLMDRVKKFLTLFPCKILAVDNTEGDDCIFALAEAFVKKNYKVNIVSSDEDLTQMCNFWPDNVTVFHPITKTYRTAVKDIIQQKMFVGDSSDNIKFKKGLGPSTYKKLKESRAVYKKYVNTSEDEDRLKRLHEIIDLRCFPLKYRQETIRLYNSAPWWARQETEFSFDDVFYDGLTKSTCHKKCSEWQALHLDLEDVVLDEPTEELDTSDVWFDYGD